MSLLYMNKIAKNILNNENNENILHSIYENIFEYITTYNHLNKIDNYESKKIDINKSPADILILREKVYELTQQLAHLHLDSKDEFKDEYQDKFCIIKVNTTEFIELFIAYACFFYLDSIHSDKSLYIGFDFEFNQRKIALCQIGFFTLRKYKYIFIYDPILLTSQQQNLLVKIIYTSPINRIMHGGDSLDIPYLYEDLFTHDRNKAFLFTKTMVDTRFLCEYFKFYTTEPNKKCSIYDALLFFKVITQKKYDDLNTINTSMGPIQDVNWNVKHMSSFHLKYAAYDVLFLKKFLFGIYKHAKEIDDNIYSQIKLIQYLTRFIYYEKYGISEILINSKLVIDHINNFIADNHNNKHTLITIYNNTIMQMKVKKHNLKLSNLLGINFFKGNLTILFKKIVYSIILDKYTIYENKKTKYFKKIQLDDMYPVFEKLELFKIKSLVKHIINDNIGNIKKQMD